MPVTYLGAVEVQGFEGSRKGWKQALDVRFPEQSISGDVARKVEEDEILGSRVTGQEVHHTTARDLGTAAEVEMRQ